MPAILRQHGREDKRGRSGPDDELVHVHAERNKPDASLTVWAVHVSAGGLNVQSHLAERAQRDHVGPRIRRLRSTTIPLACVAALPMVSHLSAGARGAWGAQH